jgi:two-component system chemotaxis sensor kinase CheA
MALTNQAVLNEFVSEAHEHLAGVSDDLLTLEKAIDDEARSCLDRLFRAMHSIKGGASLVGCRQIGLLTHLMETILDRLRQGRLTAGPPVMDGLLAGSDLVATLLDDVTNSDQVDIAAQVARLEAVINASPTDTGPPPAPSLPAVGTALAERPAGHPYLYNLRIELGAHVRQTGRSVQRLLAELQQQGCILDAWLHVPDHDLALGLPDGPVDYECQYSSAWAAEQLTSRLGLQAHQLAPVPEETQPAATPTAPTEANEPSPQAGATPRPSIPGSSETEADRPSSVRIGVQVLDRLMTLAGELVLVRNQALQAVDPDDPRMRPVVQRLSALTTDVQQAVMLTRMQPVSILFGKFPRLVRDLSRKLGKEIELSLHGTEVELDKTILEALSDPLTHLVRNACDHGIEPPADRLAAGKPAEGHINLHARQEGGRILIELRDDGRGIDPAKVRRTALARGLKSAAEMAAFSDAEAQALILLPGFSTSESVTELSGRGVGMDVVKTNVEQLRGSLQIESTPGAGTSVYLRLPLTLAIIPCLIVGSGPERYAVPQKDLEELVCLASDQAAGKVEQAHDHPVYRLRNRLLPLVWLSDVLAGSGQESRRPAGRLTEAPAPNGSSRSPAARPILNFAVVKVGAQRFGLVVDQLLDTEEIVVKPMHPALRSLRCFCGATIRGDGRVALILDIEGIARYARIAADRGRPEVAAAEEAGEHQEILVFRHGPREQFAVPLAMVRRIEEVRLSALERVGNREYLTVKGQSVRVLRLDRYLEVSAAAETDFAYLLLPRRLDPPVGILVTEIVDTLRLAIPLDSHSYRADGVIGTALVHGRMTLFLDLFRLTDRLRAEDRAQEAHVDPENGSGDRRRVLLVEDTQFFRQLVKGYLETEGYEVVTADNGALGLREIERQPFDLVVSDIEMPVMDGWQLARAVRARHGRADLPLLALTTLNSEADRRRATECGFDGYEVKVDRESFLASVRRLLQPAATLASVGGPSDG